MPGTLPRSTAAVALVVLFAAAGAGGAKEDALAQAAPGAVHEAAPAGSDDSTLTDPKLSFELSEEHAPPATDSGAPCGLFKNSDEHAVCTYVAAFMVKVLTELDAGNKKTVEHVRLHLQPFLGGPSVLAALRTDNPDDAECTACASSPAAAEGLTALRDSLGVHALARYDALKVCYPTLTDRIMLGLPKTKDGVYLRGMPSPEPAVRVQRMMRGIFADQIFGTNSCAESGFEKLSAFIRFNGQRKLAEGHRKRPLLRTGEKMLGKLGGETARGPKRFHKSSSGVSRKVGLGNATP